MADEEAGLKDDYMQSYPFISSVEESWLRKVPPNGHLGSSGAGASAYCTLPRRVRKPVLAATDPPHPAGHQTLPRSIGRKAKSGQRASKTLRQVKSKDRLSKLVSDPGIWEEFEGFQDIPPPSPPPQKPFKEWQVQYVVDDVGRRQEKDASDLQSTAFYRIVLGGNVSFIREVLEILRNQDDRKNFRWLIQPKERKLFKEYAQQKIGHKVLMVVTRVFLYIFLAAVCLFTTILFYTIHNILYSKRMKRIPRISHKIQLPMAFAGLSGSKSMILLFKEFGVDFEQKDHNLNNTFHYISDLSRDKPDKAIKAYHAMVDAVQDRDILREMIYTKGQNAEGMTPFEHMALYGSPMLITAVSKTVGIIREPVLSISDADVLMQRTEEENGIATSNAQNPMAAFLDENIAEFGSTEQPRYNLDKFNISMYESADMFGSQSKVLNIMATRELTALTEEQLDNLYKCPFLNRWWHFKVSQMHTFTSLLQWIDIIYTIIIFCLLVTVGGDTRVTPLKYTHIKATTNVFLDHLQNLPGELQPIPNDTFSEMAVNILPQFSQAFEKIPRRRILFENARSPGLRIEELTPYFKNMTGYKWINQSVINSMYNVLCNSSDTSKQDSMFLDTCQIEAINELEVTCDHMDISTIKNNILLEFGSFYDMLGFQVPLIYYKEATKYILLIIIIIAGLYLLFDLVERLIFLYRKVAHLDRPIRGILLATITTSFPGSYTKRQLNVLACSCFVAFMIYVDYIINLVNENNLSLAESEFRMTLSSYFIISGLIFRFLMHIHAMRLLPNLGHFVITTYMMGNNLLNFAAVYGAVLFVFSIIFHFLMRQVDCPALKVDEFSNLATSLYTTFQLGLGQGESDLYNINTPVKVTYVLYTIICILLLMNLIIAIMSTTATQIMTDPWKTAMWDMEWLKEALSAETTFQILTMPLQRFIGPLLMKSVGFSVGKKRGGESGNVYIEVFSCTDNNL